GGGPINFDSAFSVGDALILSKDGSHVTILSLRDGKLIARFKGGHSAVSESAKLFALDEGWGLIVVHDLTSGAKIAEETFPDRIAYSHFSPDGSRLFVLTEHQEAYVVDVSKMRAAGLSPPTPAPSP